jgi:hypothetical protein
MLLMQVQEDDAKRQEPSVAKCVTDAIAEIRQLWLSKCHTGHN